MYARHMRERARAIGHAHVLNACLPRAEACQEALNVREAVDSQDALVNAGHQSTYKGISCHCLTSLTQPDTHKQTNKHTHTNTTAQLESAPRSSGIIGSCQQQQQLALLTSTSTSMCMCDRREFGAYTYAYV